MARNNNLQIESVWSVCSVDFFSCLRQEILEEILFKNGLWPEIIIFKYDPDENALEFLAFGEDFVMDRLTGSTS